MISDENKKPTFVRPLVPSPEFGGGDASASEGFSFIRLNANFFASSPNRNIITSAGMHETTIVVYNQAMLTMIGSTTYDSGVSRTRRRY